MRVDVVSTDEEFLRLRGPWEELVAAGGGSNPFHAWTTVYHAWSIDDRLVEPLLLVARDADGIAGVLPLGATTRRNGPFRWRALTTIGPKRLDFADAVIAPERVAEVLGAFVDWLVTRWADWDDFHLAQVREDAALLKGLSELSLPANVGLAIERVGESMALSIADGAGSWEDVLEGETRRTTRRIVKRLEAGGFTTASVGDGYPLSTAVDVFVELHARRRGEFGQTSRYLAVNRSKLCAMVADVVDDGGDLLLMELGGVPVAAQLTLRLGASISHYRLAFDSEYRSFSPGIGLLAAGVDAAVKSRAREYDFGLGVEEYKRRWSNVMRSVFRVRLINRHPARAPRRLWSLASNGMRTLGTRLRRRDEAAPSDPAD